MGRVTERVPVVRVRYADLAADGAGPSAADRPRSDAVAVEEPLELRLNGSVLTVTMRTPGADIDLAHGWLLTEGIIGSVADVRTMRYCGGSVLDADELPRNTYNVLDVELSEQARASGRAAEAVADARRLGVTTSACGICGSASIEALRARLPDGDLAGLECAIALPDIADLVRSLRTTQPTFVATGGTHAALWVAPDQTQRGSAEDVGRHNAVDKVLGAALRAGAHPPFGGALIVSSRASYEIVQKAAMAGVPVVIAVSAPSSLAVSAARDLGMTLLAFARDSGVNVYAGAHRVRP